MSTILASPAITLEELIGWNDHSAQQWFQFLTANPAALDLPSGIFGTKNIFELVFHIVAVEYRYGQRLRGLPVSTLDQIPCTSIAQLAALHSEALQHYRATLSNPNFSWSEIVEIQTLSAGTQRTSMRKMLAHALMHSIRHWAQLATLTRTAGHPADISGDLLFSPSIL